MTERISSIDKIQKQILKDFSNLETELDRYKYLVSLAKSHRPDPNLHTEANLVAGCQANAWFCGTFTDEKLHFEADSESMIIRGIVVLLLKLWNDRIPAEVVATEIQFLQSPEIMGTLSPTRENGLKSIIKEFRLFAEKHG